MSPELSCQSTCALSAPVLYVRTCTSLVDAAISKGKYEGLLDEALPYID